MAVALASSNTSAVTVSPASLTFTTANWNMAQTVTVTGVEETGANANTVSETAEISYSVSGGGYDNLAPAPQRAVVSDNDGASVTSTAAATVALTEGGALATYTLVLNSQPSAAVTITPLSSDVGAVTVAPASLSFSTSNWNTAQTVMVSPVDDGDAADESASISYAISGGDYASVTLASQQVTVDDDETAGLTSTGGSSVAVTEGRTTTYTLVLTSQPSATVTVALASSNTSALTVSPASLTFTPANWNTAQTVTVTGVEETGGNANSVSETVSISYTVSGGDYASVTLAAQSVAVTDNDIPGVSSTAAATVALTEGGSAATYTIVLNAQPTAAVTIAISSGDTGAVTVAPASLMFSTSNWSTAQTVTVTPVQDSDAANESVSISYAVSGGNYATAGVTLAAQTVTVADDETAGITSTGAASIALTEEGAVVTYTIVLNTQPTGTVTVALASDDTTAVTVSPANLSFSTGTWNTAQNVMVTAVADADAASERVSINYTVSGGDYASVTLAPQPVAVTDNDTAGLTSTASATVALTEGGAVGTYTIVLDTQPSAAVTVALASSDTGAVTVSPASLMFSASTWNTAQTVTVTAVADGNAADESVTISHTVSGGDYATVTLASQRVTVDDDESIGLTSTGGSSVAVTEGSTNTYTLVLTSQPTAAVTVALSSSNATSVTVAGPGMTAAATTTLTFSTSTWNMAQTVTVTGVEDTNTVADTASISYTVSGGDYAGFTLTAQSVAVTDNDVPGLTSTAAATVALTEGGSTGSYTIVLLTQPSAAVTVTPTSSDPGAVTVSPAMLNFSTTNWSTALTVTLTAVADDDATDESVNISYMVSGGDYATVTLAAQPVTVDDDESVGLTSTGGSSLAVMEGGMATYTLALTSQPTADVMVAIASSDTSVATVSPASLTFTTTNWGTARTVTVSSPANSVTMDTTVSLSYTVSGGDYDGHSLTAQSVAVSAVRDVSINIGGSQTGGIAEGGTTSVTVTVALSPAAPSGGLTVSLTRTGTATVTTDFTTATLGGSDPNYTLAIAEGATSATFTVTAVDDSTVEFGESIIFTLQGGTGYELGAAESATVTVTVTSNERPTLALGMGSNQLTLSENNASGSLLVTLSVAAPAGGVTVRMVRTTTGVGNATLADDFTLSGFGGSDPNYTLTIPEGMTTASGTVTTVADSVSDSFETILFTVQASADYSFIIAGRGFPLRIFNVFIRE